MAGTIQYWKNKANLLAAYRGHHLGRWIHYPPMKLGASGGTRDQKALAVCANCEGTVIFDATKTKETRVVGTALTHRCPYRYSAAELAAIDAAHPVSVGPSGVSTPGPAPFPHSPERNR